MKRAIPFTLCLITAATIPTLSHASSVAVGYETLDVSGVSLSGLTVSGSLDLTENLYLSAGTGTVSKTISGLKVELDATSVGLGFKTGISETVDIYGAISSVNQKLTASWSGYTASADGSSTVYGAGLKVALSDKVDGTIGIVKSTESGSSMTTTLGLEVEVMDNIDLTVSTSNNDVVDSVAIGMQYNF